MMDKTTSTRVFIIRGNPEHKTQATKHEKGREFGDSYKAPLEETGKGVIGEGSAKKKGRIVAITTKDMQKRRNDVKARTTLLLALPDEHQLRFSKYDNAKELWEAILKTFGRNEATKKTKKNQLKHQYGNFKAEGSETLKQTFNRLQAIVSHLEFMDVPIEQDDLNQKFLSSLAPKWLVYTIVWRNRDDLDTMILDDVYNHLKFYEPEVQKSAGSNSQNMAFISSSNTNSGKSKVSTIQGVSTPSVQVSTASTDIDDDDIEEMDIKWNLALLSMRADRWNALISIRWAILLESAEHQGVKTKEEEKATRRILRKNPKNLNNKIIKLNEELSDCETDLYNYKRGLSQVEARLVEFKNNEIKLCERIRVLERDIELKDNKIENLRNELEELKKEKDNIDDKTGLGLNEYTDVPPPPAQVYSPPTNDLSWTGLPEFVDDTITDYSRPTPSIDVPRDVSESVSFFEQKGSVGNVLSKPMISFVKEIGCPSAPKVINTKNSRKPTVKYAEMYRNTSQSPKVMSNNFSAPIIKEWDSEDESEVDFALNETVRSSFEQEKFDKFTKEGIPQDNIDDKGYWDNGCFRHMTGNISYLSEYEPYDGGYVSFGHGGGKITGKGTIKTGKLKFENVYFMKELKYNLFSVSQICDNKNSVLFTDSECLVLGKYFKLDDATHVLLRTPRQQNMYSIDLKNIVSHKNLTCLIAKASEDESMLWHRRLGHLNFKTMNKLVRNNLVKGLPSKSFENIHTCVACLKGKQHKASCKTKLVSFITKPLHTLHMDLFGPTFVSSLNHKWYCLVVTDDFSRFTWTFFLKSKDETSSILKNFITEIENLKDLKVKIIRCDNEGEFWNKEMDEFCTRKGIKREFSNARTPQQNGVVERRNRTLIEATRTMLADAKLPVTFWAEAVNTACYVQNRVLVNKSQNKTPYELFNGRFPAIGFLRPFGCTGTKTGFRHTCCFLNGHTVRYLCD
ncbi:putative ribonuclease H-like domain-containing protein [Tanacetum coccineum]